VFWRELARRVVAFAPDLAVLGPALDELAWVRSVDPVAWVEYEGATAERGGLRLSVAFVTRLTDTHAGPVAMSRTEQLEVRAFDERVVAIVGTAATQTAAVRTAAVRTAAVRTAAVRTAAVRTAAVQTVGKRAGPAPPRVELGPPGLAEHLAAYLGEPTCQP
jgi:hypothetical protein